MHYTSCVVLQLLSVLAAIFSNSQLPVVTNQQLDDNKFEPAVAQLNAITE